MGNEDATKETHWPGQHKEFRLAKHLGLTPIILASREAEITVQG
jgi:hypothetical protein